MSIQLITRKELKKRLHYNPETGVFVWIKRKGSATKNGQIAGTINNRGYRVININWKLHMASRLAFLYMDGFFPKEDADHINRIRHDDRWENLRPVSRQGNMRNRSVGKNNTSGIIGVCWNKRNKKWEAQIKVNNKNIHLGYFTTKKEAAKARWNAEVTYGFFKYNTTSTAYLYIKNGCKFPEV